MEAVLRGGDCAGRELVAVPEARAGPGHGVTTRPACRHNMPDRQGCAPGRAASLQNSRTGFKSLRPCSKQLPSECAGFARDFPKVEDQVRFLARGFDRWAIPASVSGARRFSKPQGRVRFPGGVHSWNWRPWLAVAFWARSGAAFSGFLLDLGLMNGFGGCLQLGDSPIRFDGWPGDRLVAFRELREHVPSDRRLWVGHQLSEPRVFGRCRLLPQPGHVLGFGIRL